MKHKHHIIPKHMGGTDEPSNLVELTIEEHAEAHRVLYEKYGKHQDRRAWMGLAKLMTGPEILREITEEWKEKLRKPKKDKSKYFGNTNAKSLAGKPKTDEHKKAISSAHTGMKKDWLKGNKHASVLKGRKKDPDHQEAINKSLNTPEVKQKISSSWANKPTVTCPHCALVGKEGHNMNRYHFDNCKKIKNG